MRKVLIVALALIAIVCGNSEKNLYEFVKEHERAIENPTKHNTGLYPQEKFLLTFRARKNSLEETFRSSKESEESNSQYYAFIMSLYSEKKPEEIWKKARVLTRGYEDHEFREVLVEYFELFYKVDRGEERVLQKIYDPYLFKQGVVGMEEPHYRLRELFSRLEDTSSTPKGLFYDILNLLMVSALIVGIFVAFYKMSPRSFHKKFV